ncbi:MAG: hypothetical protein Q8R76_10440 [Candidatus Omnitrophota bacterium]|nr:hypothetical protein [Candidatus Omnitrophota bacterium]
MFAARACARLPLPEVGLEALKPPLTTTGTDPLNVPEPNWNLRLPQAGDKLHAVLTVSEDLAAAVGS